MLPTLQKPQAYAELAKSIFTVLLMLFTLASDAAENLLVVTSTLVNVRAHPATTAPILIKLAEGRIVTEIQRQQDWIKVGIDNAVIETGWVNSALLAPLPSTTTNEGSPQSVRYSDFETFIDKFEVLNADTQKQAGFIPFSKAELSGTDTITVTATSDWFTATQNQREEILSAVFELWSSTVEHGESITVQVLDQNNEFHMVMFR